MKKKKILYVVLALLVLVLAAGIFLIVRATRNPVAVGDMYELPSYKGEEEGKYNKELFYMNDNETFCADPFVLDNVERDGYYYLYGTTNDKILETYRSKDLENWEPMGFIIEDLYKTTEVGKAMTTNVWAPEVVYDEDLNKYIIYFSASPNLTYEEVPSGKGVLPIKGTAYLMYAAVSDSPTGTFELLDFSSAASVGAENVHTYNTKSGITTNMEDPYAVQDGDRYYRRAYPQYWSKFLFFDPELFYNKLVDLGINKPDLNIGDSGMQHTIDPHLYVDEHGNKYMYFVMCAIEGDYICGVKMENWLKPDWESLSICIANKYYTVEDYWKAENGQSVEQVPVESDTTTNEGPFVIAHNGKYYMTFSYNAYSNQTYAVMQAVADNPLGPYRKLTEDEGGIIISTDNGSFSGVSGPGHHSIIERDEKLYVLYHKHNSVELGGGNRHVNVDSMEWISIKDKEGNDLDVLYTNGPTTTVQPRLDFNTEYTNIASEAKITLEKGNLQEGSSLEPLTDGLLSLYTGVNMSFIEEYVKETYLDSDFTINMEFEEPKVVRSIMLYNSKLSSNVFEKIKLIELHTEDRVYYIDNVKCQYLDVFESEFGNSYMVKQGAMAYAEFDEIEVKSIKISVDIPKSVEFVGLSELRVLGK